MGDRSRNSVGSFLKNVYYDSFKWSLVKSVVVFAVGVYIARECKGLDLMSPVAQ
jgi:import receptor subunit TOM6